MVFGPRPQGPWAQNHKIIKIIKNPENQWFFGTWKSCASKLCGGSTERELQIIDVVILGAKSVFGNFVKKCQKYQNWIHFGYIPDGPTKL